MYESWLQNLGFRGRTAIDIGAHRGQWTFQLMKNFEKVIAVEPQPEAAAALIDRLASVDMLHKASLISAAVVGPDAHNSLRRLNLYKDSALASLVELDGIPSPIAHLYVGTVLLQQLFALSPTIDFVKVDVNGYEEDLFVGLPVYTRDTTFLVECYSARSGQCLQNLFESHGRETQVIRDPLAEPGSLGWDTHFWLLSQRKR